MHFHFTIDVDWIPGSQNGIASLLELCRKYEATPTLFVAGKFAEVYPDVLRSAMRAGCDIGCHGWLHGQEMGEDFRTCSYADQQTWIRKGTAAIESATGIRPVMFRAPNLWISETTIRVLAENDYLLDSSVPARRFDFGYGQCNYARYFRAPLIPYHPTRHHLGQCGNSQLIEVAPSAYACIPINMSALRVLGFRPVAWAVRRLSQITPVLVFYCHPAEFVSAEHQQVSPSDPKRYREGIGPHNLALVERFVRYVLSLGYRPARLAQEMNEHCSTHQ